jgi:y4mF family transcriptional regulator
MEENSRTANFVKYNRNRLKLTQQELAEKAGVGLRFIRDLEQGKTSLRMDKVNQVISLFGYQLSPGSEKILDPYEINLRYFNQPVKIELKNKKTLNGIIIEQINENNQVKGWKLISNNNAIAYKRTKDPKLEETILHKDIEKIKNQE